MAKIIKHAPRCPDVMFHCLHCHCEFTEARRICVEGERQAARFINGDQDEWDCRNGLASATEPVATLATVCPECDHVCTIDERTYDKQVEAEREQFDEKLRAKRRVEEALAREREQEHEQIRNEHRPEYKKYEHVISVLANRIYRLGHSLPMFQDRLTELGCTGDLLAVGPDEPFNVRKAKFNYVQVFQLWRDFEVMYKQTVSDFAIFKQKFNFA